MTSNSHAGAVLFGRCFALATTLFASSLSFAASTDTGRTLPASFGTPRSDAQIALELSPTLSRPLQASLERCLNQLQLQSAVRSGHLAVSLVDITDPLLPSVAQVNSNQMFYAASLPKIAILLGAFEKAAAGKLVMDADNIETLKRMIRESSNSAASEMLQKVGTEYLAGVLQSSRYRLYDAAMNGGLWVGKPYASGEATHRDPLHNLSHGATTFQVARFYYMLETGQLVSPQASAQMKEIMGSPAIHHKFVAGLENRYPDAKLFRKSGTWHNFHADSAIVEHDGRRYIAVALSDDSRGGEWLKSLIGGLDDAVFANALTRNVASVAQPAL
jgi:beta-lactamase class A